MRRHGVVQFGCLCFPSPSGPPDAPVLRELQANATSLYVSWEEPADNNAPILMYQITLQVMDDGASLVYTSNITELTVTGLTPFTVYSVQVVAVNSIGSSAPSELRTVMTAEGSECVCLHMHTPVPFIHYMWLCVCCYNIMSMNITFVAHWVCMYMEHMYVFNLTTTAANATV